MFGMKDKIDKISSEKRQEMADSLGTAEYQIPTMIDESAGIGNLIRIMLVDAPKEMKRIETEIQKYQLKISTLASQKQILKAGYDAMLLADKEINDDLKNS
jgi:hypothetical protein